MNRSKFERFATEQGLPIRRLENGKRYESWETEYAWRGYCLGVGEREVNLNECVHENTFRTGLGYTVCYQCQKTWPPENQEPFPINKENTNEPD